MLRLGAVLAVGVVLGRLGPFGTFSDLDSGARYAYWLGLTLLMWLQSLAALTILSSSARTRRLGWLATVGAAAALGSIPTAFEVAWAEMFLRVERDLSLVDVFKIYGDVLLLAVPLLLLTQGYRPTRTDSPADVLASGDVGWLLDKLPPQRRGRLLSLSSEDHYVRVRTSSGSELIHMRLSDAVARLGREGVQVHRSWWVAKGAVRSQRREGERIILELVDGTAVPVSRSFVVATREAGLIRGS